MKVGKEDSISFKPQKNSSLMLGIIFVGILGTVLFLFLRSEQTGSKIDEAIASQEERLSNIEEQILLFDEVKANDSSLNELSLAIIENDDFAKEQIKQALWPNIQRIDAELLEIEETLDEVLRVIQDRNIKNDDSIAKLNVNINDLQLSIEEIYTQFVVAETTLRSLQSEVFDHNKQILFLQESVQALEGYRGRNNQVLQDVLISINNIENSIIDIQNEINNEDVKNDNSIDE